MPQTSETEGVRVILLGRTGLDSALRRDPGVELVRARTPLDALGELSDPMEGRSVVIVDPDAEPAASGPGDLAEFIAGLRRVDPGVRVLRVSHNGAALPSGYDGGIDVEHAQETLRRFIENGAAGGGACEAGPGASVEVKGAPVAAACARGEREAGSASGAGAGETVLLRRVIDGEPVMGAALELIRARLGAGDVVFAGRESGRSAPAWSAWASAPVRVGTGGEIAGELRSRVAGAAALEGQAVWLGAWLELEARQAELREAAYRDPLTGAWNRRYFDGFLARAIEEARRARRALTVLVFDIDDFKRFNDAYGHGAGDEILTECVRLLSAAVRPTDKVCRIGGDEFAVIFYEPEGPREPDSRHPTSVFDVAERFQSQLRSAQFRKLRDELPGCLTISGGLATYPWDGRTAEELVERADQLALEGKKQGKNVIAIGPGCRRLGRA
ncbi:MAG TPA: GGDEF domain-containing protein [Phycisphaerales bacterium]|nr:GGDEF domain-containing protein [Phycisphaerales bacterium]